MPVVGSGGSLIKFSVQTFAWVDCKVTLERVCEAVADVGYTLCESSKCTRLLSNSLDVALQYQ